MAVAPGQYLTQNLYQQAKMMESVALQDATCTNCVMVGTLDRTSYTIAMFEG